MLRRVLQLSARRRAECGCFGSETVLEMTLGPECVLAPAAQTISEARRDLQLRAGVGGAFGFVWKAVDVGEVTNDAGHHGNAAKENVLVEVLVIFVQ